jgi:hypothetical protein
MPSKEESRWTGKSHTTSCLGEEIPSHITIAPRPAETPTQPPVAQVKPVMGPSSFPSLPQARPTSKQGSDTPLKPLTLPLPAMVKAARVQPEPEPEPELEDSPKRQGMATFRRNKNHQQVSNKSTQTLDQTPAKSAVDSGTEPAAPSAHDAWRGANALIR